jgi:quinol monooxygenase YgiN
LTATCDTTLSLICYILLRPYWFFRAGLRGLVEESFLQPFEENHHAKICERRHDRGCPGAEGSGRNFASSAQDTRENEPGTLQFEVLLPKDDDTKVLSFEMYRDAAAFEAHLHGPSLAQLLKETAGMVMKLHGVRCAAVD